MTDLANERLADAAKAVERAAEAAESGQNEQAAREARAAARKLESTARQVGALKARDLADRLARQRDLAQAIAKAERELGHALGRAATDGENDSKIEKGLANTQGELADEVATLADVLKQLQIAAAEEQPELAQTISQAAQANPPKEVENSMRQNVAAIGAGRTVEAARKADNAGQRLDALALDLESARRARSSPSSTSCWPPRKTRPNCNSGSASCDNRRSRQKPRRPSPTSPNRFKNSRPGRVSFRKRPTSSRPRHKSAARAGLMPTRSSPGRPVISSHRSATRPAWLKRSGHSRRKFKKSCLITHSSSAQARCRHSTSPW